MHNAPPAQTPSTSGGRRPRHRRSAAIAAAPLLAPLLAPLAAPGVAHAQDYAYTGSCSADGTDYAGTAIYRSFRARLPITRDGADWDIVGYDYTYSVSRSGTWGPHSDERITITRGLVSGPSPWHSPDNHTTNVSWVQERGWKASTVAGASGATLHAWFDVPNENDPECNASTATF